MASLAFRQLRQQSIMDNLAEFSISLPISSVARPSKRAAVNNVAPFFFSRSVVHAYLFIFNLIKLEHRRTRGDIRTFQVVSLSLLSNNLPFSRWRHSHN